MLGIQTQGRSMEGTDGAMALACFSTFSTWFVVIATGSLVQMNYLLEIWQYISIGIRYLIKQIGKISYTPQPQLKNTVPNHKEIMVSYFIITVHFSTKQVWIK